MKISDLFLYNKTDYNYNKHLICKNNILNSTFNVLYVYNKDIRGIPKIIDIQLNTSKTMLRYTQIQKLAIQIYGKNTKIRRTILYL